MLHERLKVNCQLPHSVDLFDQPHPVQRLFRASSDRVQIPAATLAENKRQQRILPAIFSIQPRLNLDAIAIPAITLVRKKRMQRTLPIMKNLISQHFSDGFTTVALSS